MTMLFFKIKVLLVSLAVLLNFGIGIFVYFKDRFQSSNKDIGLMGLFSGLMCLGYTINDWLIVSVLFYGAVSRPLLVLYLARFTHIGIFIMVPWLIFLLRKKSVTPKRLKIIKYVFYGISFILFVSILLTKGIIESIAWDISIKEYVPVHGSFSSLLRLYYIIILTWGLYILRQLYLSTDKEIEKTQIKIFSIGSGIFSIGSIIFAGILPILGIRTLTFMVAPLSLFLVGFTAYAIIRYRFLEIETVVHKTFLWLFTSGLFFIPLFVLVCYSYPWLDQIGVINFGLFVITIVYLYAFYYKKTQPLINHWFRRKEYDYQQLLLETGEKLTRQIDINVITSTLLREILGTMYLRNGVIFVDTKEQNGYTWQAGLGYGTAFLPSDNDVKNINVSSHYSKVVSYFKEKPEVLEQQQFNFNPQYESIKEEGEKLFDLLAIEVLVPLVVEKRLIGLLGLGKKESLKSYTLRDIEVLEKLARAAGVALFNAFHHQEIMEKERLAEALRLRRRKQIERKILSYQEQLRKLMNELLITEQRERARLALALHDNITQNLAVSRLKLAELLALPKSAEIDNRLRLISGVLEETLQYVRSYTFELSPPILHEIGLEAALDTLFEKMQEKYQIAITMKANQTPRQLEPQLGILLYETVRELLMNVVKHAQASEVTVEIGEEKNHLSISVNDNGKGFTVAESPPFYYRAGHLGLFSVRERLNYVGGDIKIDSKIGAGTKVFITAPLKIERGQA